MGPSNFLLLSAILFIAILVRYFVFAGFFDFVLFKLFKKKTNARIINKSERTKDQVAKEIAWSALTSVVFALFGASIIYMWQIGWMPVYIEFNDYPIWYIPLSLVLAFFIHETYYYWLHRWMHLPKIYRLVHKVHHDSLETSSWTSFSFHPLEALAQVIVIPIIMLLVPMHLSVLIIFLTFMTVSGTLNHAGVELYPKNFKRHWFWKWIIGATHHDQHHKKFRYNFGLYFTFWDKWMGTESEDFRDK